MLHKTYRGKMIDLETIRRKNEDTVAVGNMGVNARGDKLGPGGRVIAPVQEAARRHHNRTAVSTETVGIKGDMPADAAGVLEEKPVKKGTKKKVVKETETKSGDIIIEDENDESSSTEE